MADRSPWQPEDREHAVVESGHGTNPVAGEGEYEHSVGMGDSGHRIMHVQAERGLSVSQGANGPVGSAVAEDYRPEGVAGNGPSLEVS
jgi:hypothetical protein